ncbi:hypothetical protein F8388_011947 [Cannabis sativa]|uniref:Uncharacterized protein n=1 Tax=Cannabis sativa TaxID=3483 RepID=A0A7J6GDJ5_CANSA|nr:hypothetical protein F8388_011947 [Cannabis sativa]
MVHFPRLIRYFDIVLEVNDVDMDNEGKLIKIVGLLNETKVAAVEAKRQISSMRDRLAEFREQQQRTYERLSASLHALRDLVNDNLRANVNVRVVNNVVGGEIEDDCESVITVENDLMEEEEEEEADEVESDESTYLSEEIPSLETWTDMFYIVYILEEEEERKYFFYFGNFSQTKRITFSLLLLPPSTQTLPFQSDTAAGDTTFSADASTQKFSPRRDPPIKSLAVRALALYVTLTPKLETSNVAIMDEDKLIEIAGLVHEQVNNVGRIKSRLDSMDHKLDMVLEHLNRSYEEEKASYVLIGNALRVLSNSISSLNCNAPVVNNNGAEIEECESGITVENDLMEEEEVDKEEEESDEVQMEKE